MPSLGGVYTCLTMTQLEETRITLEPPPRSKREIGFHTLLTIAAFVVAIAGVQAASSIVVVDVAHICAPCEPSRDCLLKQANVRPRAGPGETH